MPTPPRNRTPLIVGGIAGVVVVVGVIVTLLLVFMGSRGPADVLDRYLQAAKAGDVATGTDLTCEKYRAAMADARDNPEPELSWEIHDVHISGDTATVDITLINSSPNGGTPLRNDLTVHMVKEGGDWKVCES
jgi:hypothetical protein